MATRKGKRLYARVFIEPMKKVTIAHIAQLKESPVCGKTNIKGRPTPPTYRLKVLYPDGTYSAIFEVPIKEMPINPINKEK
jgi:hypothetical protein